MVARRQHLSPVPMGATSGQISDFAGRDGFTKLNNAWFDEILSHIANLAELKVVQYIYRHTEGFRQEEVPLSIEEIMHGRLRWNGERYDHGTGLCERSVKSGIKRAVAHGYLVRREVGNRVFFSLSQAHSEGEGEQAEEGQNVHPEALAEGDQNVHPKGGKTCTSKVKTCTQKRQDVHPLTSFDQHSDRSTSHASRDGTSAKEKERKYKEREKESALSVSPKKAFSVPGRTSALPTRHDPPPEHLDPANQPVSLEERQKLQQRLAALRGSKPTPPQQRLAVFHDSQPEPPPSSADRASEAVSESDRQKVQQRPAARLSASAQRKRVPA